MISPCKGLLVRLINQRTMLPLTKTMNATEQALLEAAKAIVPKLSQEKHKGQAGRVGVIGGSVNYTGAPYFSAISALKVGCDLVHVFCEKEAAPIIKSYSPELIVHPVLDSESGALNLMKPWLPRLHVLVIGPGMGRDPDVMKNVADIINFCREEKQTKPLVIDADGLFLLTEQPELIKNYPHGAVLTPNAIEFARLAGRVIEAMWLPTETPSLDSVAKLAAALGPKIVVAHKAAVDVIADGAGRAAVTCSEGGSGRRCGGQGDLLSGTLGAFLAWAVAEPAAYALPRAVIASYAACRLTRECNTIAFRQRGRSMLTSDMIEQVHPAFEKLFGP